MTNSAQDKLTEIDISERLRSLMREHKLTVSEIAKIAGISKSAMEKYLAGPSSPRATAIVSICRELRASADWLLLGKPDGQESTRRAVHTVLYQLVMKQRGKTVEPFITHDTEELRLADHLTKETLKLIQYYKELDEGSAEWSQELGKPLDALTVAPSLDEDDDLER